MSETAPSEEERGPISPPLEQKPDLESAGTETEHTEHAEEPEEPTAEPPPDPEPARRRRNRRNVANMDIWQQLTSYTPGEWSHLKLYLYRTAPVTDRLAGVGSYKFISRFEHAVDEQDIKLEHGSGRYKFRLNQATGGSDGDKTIRSAEFQILDPKYPPEVPLGEWVDDPKNKQWAWAKEILEQREHDKKRARDSNHGAGAGQSPKEWMEALETAVKVIRPDDDAGSTTRAVLEAMRTTHQETFALFKTQASDPLKTIEIVAGLMKTLQPAQPTGPDPMMQHVLEELRDARKQNTDLMARLLDQKSANPLDSFTQVAEGLAKATELFGNKGRPAKTDWMDVLGRVGERLAETVGPAVPLILRQRATAAAAGAAQPTGAPQLFATPPPPASAGADGTPSGIPPGAAQSGATPPIQEEENMISVLIQQISAPLLQHLEAGSSGETFGDWFVAGYGRRTLEMVRTTGRDKILHAIQANAELWATIQPMEPAFLKFLDEFVAWTPAVDEEAVDPDEAAAEPVENAKEEAWTA